MHFFTENDIDKIEFLKNEEAFLENLDIQQEYVFVVVSLLKKYSHFGVVGNLIVSDNLDQIKGTIENQDKQFNASSEVSFCIEKIFHSNFEKQVIALDIEVIKNSQFDFRVVKIKATDLLDLFLNNQTIVNTDKFKDLFDFLKKHTNTI